MLFLKQTFRMHSGALGRFKIECNGLQPSDWETLAFLISQKFTFREVHGIPRGGVPLEDALQTYKSSESKNRLIVDDVFTTGGSMGEAKLMLGWKDAIGVVVFARNENPVPDWIHPMFQLWK